MTTITKTKATATTVRSAAAASTSIKKRKDADKPKLSSFSPPQTGRRKRGVARVWIVPAASSSGGEVVINSCKGYSYFPSGLAARVMNVIQKPFAVVGCNVADFNVVATVKGGGLMGQLDAVALGLSRSLAQLKESYRSLLRHADCLKRDPRVKERKKVGHRKARKSPQFSKR